MAGEMVPFGRDGLIPFSGALTTQGSATWMSSELAKSLGLYDLPGLLFARGKHGILRYPAARGKHAIVCAPSRSGKGVGFVIPNLLTWPGSCFAIDPKGELAHYTADRRREMGQRVYVLDPCRVSGQRPSRFNPLDWIAESPEPDTDLRLIVEALMPDIGGLESFWNGAARELLLGILMYLFATPEEPKTLGRAYDLLNAPEGDWERTLRKMATADGPSAGLNAKVRDKARWFQSLHDDHQQYHRGTCQFHLAWLGIDVAREMVSASDFDIREIKNGRATVYVCIPALSTATYAGFSRVLATLAIKAVAMRLESPGSGKPPALLLLDEFATTVGRMKVFDDAFTNLAGYGGRFAIVLQSIDQLQSLFPERKGNQSWKTIYENAGLRLFFDAQGETARFVSDQLGMTTVNQISPVGGPKQVQRKLRFENEVSFPTDDQGRPVPDAVFGLVEGFPAVRARRLKSYRDAEFVRLHDPDAPVPEHVPTGLTDFQIALRGFPKPLPSQARPELVAERGPLPEPPRATIEQKGDYLRLGGWGL